MWATLSKLFGRSSRPGGPEARIGTFLSTGPAARIDDPLATFQRFDLAGHGVKGLTSSGFSQAGYGLDLNVSADLGTFVCPWLIQIPIKLDVGGERTTHTEMVLTTFPRRVWSSRLAAAAEVAARAAESAWSSPHRLVLTTLRGVRWEGHAGLSAELKVGIGDPLGADELSGVKVAGGIQDRVSVDGTISTTNLVDLAPRRFSSAYTRAAVVTSETTARPGVVRQRRRVARRRDGSDGLAEYVDNELEGDVKRRVIDWMAQKIGDGTVSGWVRSGRWLNDAVSEAADHWAATQHHDPAFDVDPTGGIKRFFGRIKTRPSTTALVTALNRLDDDLKNAGGLDAHQAMVNRANRAMVADLIAVLNERKRPDPVDDLNDDNDAQPPVPPVRRPPRDAPFQAGVSADAPAAKLRIGSRTFSAKAAAAVSAKAIVGAVVKFEHDYTGKWIDLRHQSNSVDRDGRYQLVYTQDTLLRYNLYTASVAAQGTTANSGRLRESRRGRQANYGTVCYASACVYWEHKGGTTIRALPNGSGVSLGVSFDADRLRDYVMARQSRPKGDLGDAKLQKTETYLISKLGVTSEQLVAFIDGLSAELLRDIWANPELDSSVLLEAAFGLFKAHTVARDPHLTRVEPANLLKTSWADSRRTAKPDADETSDLSAIRLRYRKRRAVDKSRPLLSFGWAFTTDTQFDNKKQHVTPFRTFGSPVGVGGGPRRIERIGAEGIVDLHVRFFPDLRSDSDGPAAFELTVPGVTLFSQ